MLRARTLDRLRTPPPRPEQGQELWPSALAPWRALDSERPMELEIGAGNGVHAIARARSHPERDVIAIERTHSRFAAFAARVRSHQRLGRSEEIHALWPIHADAVSWVTHELPRARVSQVWILYPNPWPKCVHRNRRWFEMPFMGRLLESLRPGGAITLATNIGAYFDEACALAERRWGLTLVAAAPLAPSHAPRTPFERKYLARGEVCYELTAKLNRQN